ncbi:MAG: SDR family oxidoreductase [Fibrobacteraceae bacterium]|nr:SDR family oxidoreductase [Fibrobacteraceae bacterium]
MANLFSLENKDILVTGASSGIGRAIAVLCSQSGATVYITARREDKLDETLSLMAGTSNKKIIADLSKNENIDDLIEQLPKIDGVVHCAGIGSRVLCKSVTREEIDKVMGVNFIVPVMLQTTLLAKKKLNKGSSIVFIASYGANSPAIANSIYSASKGAIISYANCLALEVAPRGIRVNCISPAMVWTDLIVKDGIDAETLKEDEKKYPLGRYGKPEDIAPLAVYLLSDSSSWMTTTNVKITGGGS